MENKQTIVNRGVGFTGLLTIAFIVLKLANIIKWSWIWVLSPLWINFLIGTITICLTLFIIVVIDPKKKNKHNQSK